MEDNKIVEGLDNIVLSIQKYKDSIIQLQRNNKKLNDDMLVLEKEKDLAYTSFNTDTHLLVDKSVLESIIHDLEEAKDYAYQASGEADSAKSSAEEAEYSAKESEEYTEESIFKIEKLIKAGEAPVEKVPARKNIDNQD